MENGMNSYMQNCLIAVIGKWQKRLNSSVSFGALLINLSNVLGCFQHEPTAVYPDAGEYEIIFLRLTFLLPKQ